MNPTIEIAGAIWNVLQPDLPFDVAKLKLTQVASMGIVSVLVKDSVSILNKHYLQSYMHLIQVLKDVQQQCPSANIMDANEEFHISNVFFNQIHEIAVMLDPHYNQGISATVWYPFIGVAVDKHSSAVVEFIRNRVVHIAHNHYQLFLV